jgi:antitoxin MazE
MGATRARESHVRTEFVKWGNSLALRVPSAFAKEVGAAEGKRAEMTVENGALIVKVARSRRRRYNLEKLIAGITKENRHPEIDWGPPVGAEIW